MESKKGNDFRGIVESYLGEGFWNKVLTVPVAFCCTTAKKECVSNCDAYVSKFLRDKQVVVILGNDVYKALMDGASLPDLLYGNHIPAPGKPYEYFFMCDYNKFTYNSWDEDELSEYWVNLVSRQAVLLRKFLKTRRIKHGAG